MASLSRDSVSLTVKPALFLLLHPHWEGLFEGSRVFCCPSLDVASYCPLRQRDVDEPSMFWRVSCRRYVRSTCREAALCR